MSGHYLGFEGQDDLQRLISQIREQVGPAGVDLAVVLGSGWGRVAELGTLIAEFSYADFPSFPPVTVPGHSGQLKIVEIVGWKIVFFVGRFHCYQGMTAYEAAFPARLASAVGCRRILLTCATGGINPEYRPGDFVYIADHLNLLSDNPLHGVPDHPFVDLTSLYDQSLFQPLTRWCHEHTVGFHRGVLAAMPGPSYETPAEIRMLRMLGADLASMSMVPEAIMSCYLRIKVVGLAFVANFAAGLGTGGISHEEVLARGAASQERCSDLIERLIHVWQSQ